MNHKRTYKSGAIKKAEKKKRELLAIQSSPYQKKLCFTTLDRIEVADNNTKSKFFSCINVLYLYLYYYLVMEFFTLYIFKLTFINI